MNGNTHTLSTPKLKGHQSVFLQFTIEGPEFLQRIPDGQLPTGNIIERCLKAQNAIFAPHPNFTRSVGPMVIYGQGIADHRTVVYYATDHPIKE